MVERGRECGAVRSASVNETAMSDERAAQRRVECTLHAVVWFVMSAVNCCPGRRCRIVKSRSRRGAAQRCRCTCACVLPTHVNRSSSCSCTASLFADDDDDDAGQSAVCSAPCSTPTARRRAASARRRPGVCTTRAHRSQLRRPASSCAACSNRWRPPSRTPSSARRCTISPVTFNVDEVGARPCTSTPTARCQVQPQRAAAPPQVPIRES